MIGALVLTSFLLSAPPDKHRVVIDLGGGGRVGFESALGNTKNLLKAFGSDPVQVEIVCYGPGIDLILSHDNPLIPQIDKLHQAGVVFAACNNTLMGRHIDRSRVLRYAVVVDAGVAEIVRREEAGWSYLKR